ncbi:carboxypeptidase [Yersinia enterocolitica subsp. palearctica YE-P4]|uniref:Thermostable carboxypeptidase 1 Zinc-requiring, any residue but Pro n=1 Tax=Yersinia enterocolitica subsp. palearctica serotype O:3 (strain DSM 13030 / CIP 106945 / Y11) TaxID=930944 RepID=A0A0H3NQ99_YERE1|nr:carboxypeptidase [Yersinia enterocolitica subsp. palearctica YE-149]EOR79734.1 carboxypeptidase [Yersinia enterocolitica subsp. palearctica YE-P1]EOR79800.1 carboxypeptidase [Yersinia enterocolitica subsp. palearctica YE-150]EOR83104.1 carboxypeptidase [Yersinia enterocolitica subsp. palearctica YE-P4]MDW9425705.1 carboxypeptidase [Yersinia enterocolitica]CBY27278.1 thermostable carboxypeptidase 1; Zinc-requiring, any residue but Pro [Yersinia enterocolitica subsp. palearctica Y11]CCO68610
MTTVYQSLRTTFTRLSRFEHLSAIAGWDMQTRMHALLQFTNPKAYCLKCN